MTKPLVINHSGTVDQSDISVLIQGACARNVTFIHGTGDAIEVSATTRHPHLHLEITSGTRIVDETRGMHISLDPFSLETTFENFQNDPCAKIDLLRSPFQDRADLAAHLQVVPQGTILNAAIHGPMVAFFPGDYNVRPEQFNIHH